MEPPDAPASAVERGRQPGGMGGSARSLRALGHRDTRVLVVGARLGMFAITGAATGAAAGRSGLILLSLLAVPATLASVTAPGTRTHRIAVLAEALLCGLAVGPTGGPTSPLLAYLVIPALDAGAATGETGALVATGTSALGLLAGALGRAKDTSSFLGSAAQWTLVSLAIGLLAARLRRLSLSRSAAEEAGFGVATRLLDDLREVTRRLPGPLEPVSAASSLLDECLDEVAMAGGAVLRRTPGARLEPLVMHGWASLPAWVDSRPLPDVDTTIDSRPYWVPVDPAAPAGPELVVVPLITGTAFMGVVLLGPVEGGRRPAESTLEPLIASAKHHALRLEASLLFDELRTLATTEERRRLAREIHDGVAQELVHLGYAVDALRHEIPPSATSAHDSAQELRRRLTELISELRLSIFDLRSAVDPTAGLGASISEYARTVGGAGGMTVHLQLSETAARLPPSAAFELLRIAQEAVSNARKHSGANNLWVTLTSSPPYALLRVEDDGCGISGTSGGGQGFGLSVMRERATRLGSELTLRPRRPAGTTVQVEIGRSRRPAPQDEDPSQSQPPDSRTPDVLDYLS